MHNILNKKYEATIAILTKKTFIFENFLGRAFWREDKKTLSASFEERGVLGHLYVWEIIANNSLFKAPPVFKWVEAISE